MKSLGYDSYGAVARGSLEFVSALQVPSPKLNCMRYSRVATLGQTCEPSTPHDWTGGGFSRVFTVFIRAEPYAIFVAPDFRVRPEMVMG